MIPNRHIRRVLVLSTGHVSHQTMTMLDNTEPENWPVYGGKIPHGWYIYAHDENDGKIPPDLWACCDFARKSGFDYIQFDCDWDQTQFPQLPAYRHDDGEVP